MPRIVAVGLDGSPESLAAAEWAAREAELRGLALQLVHVWEAPQPIGWAAMLGEGNERSWAEEILQKAAEELRRHHPDLELAVRHIDGRPGLVLPRVAAEAELLVLGSRGLSGVTGFLVGSVGLATVAHATRPVVLVRSTARAEDERRPDADCRPSATAPHGDVVVGLDGENPGDAVIEFAFEAASRRAARLRVVHGWSPPPSVSYGLAMDQALNEEPAHQAKSAVDAALAPWREKFPGVEVVEQTVIGSAGDHLVDAAREASLVVVGRRIRHMPLGSRIGPVTHAVLHHATVPVSVVPHA